MKRKLANFAVCVVVLAAIPCLVTGYHDHYTCVLCRAIRTDYIYLDHKWGTKFDETTCSRWYRENVESTHDHVWVRGRASAWRDLYGRRFGAIDRDPAGKAIWRLAPDDQVAIYEHLPERKRKGVFLSLVPPGTANGRDDYEIVRVLQDWKDGGFQDAMPIFTRQ